MNGLFGLAVRQSIVHKILRGEEEKEEEEDLGSRKCPGYSSWPLDAMRWTGLETDGFAVSTAHGTRQRSLILLACVGLGWIWPALDDGLGLGRFLTACLVQPRPAAAQSSMRAHLACIVLYNIEANPRHPTCDIHPPAHSSNQPRHCAWGPFQ